MNRRTINLHLVSLFLVLVCLALPASAWAYSMNMLVNIDVKQIHPDIEAIQVSCALEHDSGSLLQGQRYQSLSGGAYQGVLVVEVEATEPVYEYQGFSCELRLCRAAGQDHSCAEPISQTQYDALVAYNWAANHRKEPLVYDTARAAQTRIAQSRQDSIVMATPPPSHQLAGQATAQGSSGSAQSSNRSSSGQGGGVSQLSKDVGDSAGDANTYLGYTELVVSIAEAVAQKNVIKVGEVVMNAVGVTTNAAFNQAEETAIGIVGDIAGLGLSVAGAAASGGAAAGSIAAAGAAGVALPVLGALSGGVALGSKLNKALDEPVLKLLEATIGYDEEDGRTEEDFRAAREEMRQRMALEEAQLGKGKKVAAVAGAATQAAVKPGKKTTTPSSTPATTPGSAPAPGATEVGRQTQQEASADERGTELRAVGKAKKKGVAAAGVSGDYIALEGEMVNEETGESEGEAEGEGVYVVYDENGNPVEVDGEPTGGQRGGAAGNSSTPGNGSGGSGNGTEEGDSNGGSGEGSGEGSSESNNEDCTQPGAAGCDSSSEDAADDQQAETEETETAGDSTPDPRDRDNMSEGVAWAMQNPDNPMAQSILATAAQSVEDLSGNCQAGCADSQKEGGVLWAMNNPDNPLAQQILAQTAEAISDNSGSGHSGGADDNPTNEPINPEASDNDLRRIALLVAGGGVVDPPEDGGQGPGPSSGGDPITGSGDPITGGDPVTTGAARAEGMQVRGGLAEGFSGDPDNPDNPENEVDVDTNQIRAGGLR